MSNKLTDYTNLISEWDYDKNTKINLDINEITDGCSKKAWWKCEKGHHYMASINNKTSSKKN